MYQNANNQMPLAANQLPPPPPPLMKNKAFLIFFILGICCIVAEMIVVIYSIVNVLDCIDNFYCLYETYNYNTCIIGTSVYCCGTYGSYSCGGYSSCYYEGDFFVDCSGRWIACWVLGVASFAFLLGMIIIAIGHRRKTQSYYMVNQGMIPPQQPLQQQPNQPYQQQGYQQQDYQQQGYQQPLRQDPHN